jgi:UDP-2,3-diacylglucosamine pyrophosphatase LpxH
VRVNATLSRLRRLLRRPGYWSLAGFAKSHVKRAVSFIFDFEDSLIHAVRERGLDGVICGHIHSAALRRVDDVVYVNCGDWVDSCTAIVEHHDGRLELVRAWQPVVVALPTDAPHSAVSPAPTLDELPQAGIAVGRSAIRL